MTAATVTQEEKDYIRAIVEADVQLELASDKSGLKVGDTVQIVRKDSWPEGYIGEIIKIGLTSTSYIVEPYDHPYYNDPENSTKMGPFSAKELKKVKKPKGASLEYDETKLSTYQEEKLSASEFMKGGEAKVSGKGPAKSKQTASKPKKSTGGKRKNAKRDEVKKAMGTEGNTLTTNTEEARKAKSTADAVQADQAEDKDTETVEAQNQAQNQTEQVESAGVVDGASDLPRLAQVALADGTMPKLTKQQKEKLDQLIEHRGNSDITKQEMLEVSKSLFGKEFALNWVRKFGPENRSGRGVYSLKALQEAAKQ